MSRMLSKVTMATLVMGATILGMAGVTFAGTTPTTSPTPIYNSATNTYEVYTAQQLESIDNNQSTYLHVNIDLMNNIDLTGYSSWVPFGGNSYNSYAAYSGTFDGQGHVVTGLTLDDTTNISTRSTVGFFGHSSGTIKNLGISATVENPGHGTVGVLAGEANNVEDCFSNGAVSGGDDTGGLVGQQDGSITDSYSTAIVSGPGAQGGLVGQQGGNIKNSYATGSVSGGGLVGTQLLGSINGSFFDTQTTGQSQGVFNQIGPAFGSGTGETTGNMKKESTFTTAPANWDFATTWGIDPGINNGYPYLLVLKNSYAGGGLNGQLPEVPFAGGLPLLGLASAGALWFSRRRKGPRA